MLGTTFGSPVFTSASGRVEPDAEQHFSLLLVLSAADPAGLPRDEVAALLWPRVSLDAARHSLRQTMYRLRQLGFPVQARGGLVGVQDGEAEIDLRHLMRGTTSHRTLIGIGTLPFLPGFAPGIGVAFSAWLEELRERVDRVRRRALVDAVRDARGSARFAELHRLAPALLALDPLNETATLCYAEALVMDGSKVEAVQLLEAYEAEVGSVSEALRLPARALRRRVCESLDDALLPRKFEVPFVGREEEFKVLRNAFLAARGGAGQCAVITGEPGIGKTRLATELLRVGVLDGALAVTYACTSGDAITPLSSILGLTGALLGQPGALGCGQEHLSYLRRLINPEPGNPVAGGMTADVAYAQLVYSVSELTAAITDEAPLMMFIDDAQRLHQTSWRIFTDVARRVGDKRFLLMLASRQLPEWYPSLGINGSGEPVHQARLQPFGIEESLAFLDHWSRRNGVPLPDDETSRFTAQARGNPFYLGELAAHRGRGGSADAPPPSIRALIDLQFASLTDVSQRVLLVVSLLQSRATLDRVAQSLDVRPLGFLSALNELEQAGLIVSGGTGVRLKHTLVADVTQSLSPETVLTYLRTRVAAVLESEAGVSGNVDLLSDAVNLWEQSGDVEKTVATSMRLGDLLLEMGLTEESALAYARVRKHVSEGRILALAVLGELRALWQANSWSQLSLALGAIPKAALAELQTSEETEMDLLRVEAELFMTGECDALTSLFSIVEDRGQEQALRHRACTLALMAVDNSFGSKSLAAQRAAVDAFLEEFSDEASSVLARVILATHLGQHETALALASLLVETRALPAQRTRMVRQAAHANIRNGRPDRAFELLVQCLSDARSLRLPVHRVLALGQMMRLAAHSCSAEMLEVCLIEKRDADLLPQHELLSHHLSLVNATLSWITQDRALAARSHAELEIHGRRAGGTHAISLTQARVLIAAVCPEVGDGYGLVQEYTRDFQTQWGRGSFDHVVAAVASVLRPTADSTEALVLERYFREGRVEMEGPSTKLLDRIPKPIRGPIASAIESRIRPGQLASLDAGETF